MEINDNNASETLVVMFVLISLFFGTVSRLINKKLQISESGQIFVYGLLLSMYFGTNTYIGQSISKMQKLSSQGVLNIFLPILSFYSAFTIDYTTFRKQWKQVLGLGLPNTIVNGLILTLGIKIIYPDNTFYSWAYAFILGSILSATDGFSTVDLVKQKGMSNKFQTLIKSEALFNNAVSYSLILLGINLHQNQDNVTIFNMVIQFLCLNLSAILFGLLIGYITTAVIKRIFNDYIQVTNLTFLCGFLSLFLTEDIIYPLGLPISGLMTLLAVGIYMAAFGKSKINPASNHALIVFWGYAVFAAKCILFLLAGTYCDFKSIQQFEIINIKHFYALLAIYTFMIIARFMSLQIHKNIIQNHGTKLSDQEILVLWHTGGIRGAICICFTLIIYEQPEQFNQNFRTVLLFHVSGCVLFSLLLNSITSGPLINYLGFLQKSRSKLVMYAQFMLYYLKTLNEKKEQMKDDKFLQVTDWNQVDQLAGVAKIQKKLDKLKNKHNIEGKHKPYSVEMLQRGESSVGHNYQNLNEDEKACLEEARNKTIQCIKGVLYNIYEQNQCSGETHLVLRQVLDDDHDECKNAMKSWLRLSEYFYEQTSIDKIEKISKFPIIGAMIKSTILSELNEFFDSVSTYMISIERTKKIVQQLNFEPYIDQVIQNELEDNLQHAEEYYYGYLQVSYDSIAKQVQTKKAAISMIESQRKFAENRLLQGQISENEYNKVKEILDSQLLKLENIALDFKEEPYKHFIVNLPFFKLLNSDQIENILEKSVLIKLKKEEVLFNFNENIESFFVIQKGSAIETYQNNELFYKERKAVGSMVSYLNLFSPNKKYISTFVAQSDVTIMAFDIKIMKQCLKNNNILKDYIYKENMKILKHIQPVFYDQFNHLDTQQILAVLSLCTFHALRPAQIIDLPEGAILISGAIAEYESSDSKQKELVDNYNFVQKNAAIGNQKQKERSERFNEQMQQQFSNQYFQGPCIVYPKLNQNFLVSNMQFEDSRQRFKHIKIIATKKTVLFKFNDFEQANDIMTVDTLADQVRNSYAKKNK